MSWVFWIENDRSDDSYDDAGFESFVAVDQRSTEPAGSLNAQVQVSDTAVDVQSLKIVEDVERDMGMLAAIELGFEHYSHKAIGQDLAKDQNLLYDIQVVVPQQRELHWMYLQLT